MLKLISFILLLSQLVMAQMILVNPNRANIINPPVSGSPSYTSGADYVWVHTSLTNNSDVYEWFDSTANNLRIYNSTSDLVFQPRNVDSGVVWTEYDNYFRQVASFPAGLFDGAFTIE